MINNLIIFLKTFPLEGYIWISALTFLAIINTESAHFTLCPFYNLGIQFCPGCGLGRSVHYLINLNFAGSFNAHPLGIIVFFLLVKRIFRLAKNNMQQFKSKLSY